MTKPLSDSELRDLRIRVVAVREKKYPWHDLCVEILIYHDIQQRLLGKAPGGRPKTGVERKGWGIRDTARELGLSIGTLCELMNLGREFKKNESLKEMSLDRAMAFIRKKQ